MSEAFEIKVGTIGRLISCENCQSDYGPCEEWEGMNCCADSCVHRELDHQPVRVVEQYQHEDPEMVSDCFVISSLDGKTHVEDIRMWDLERLSPLEELAAQAE